MHESNLRLSAPAPCIISRWGATHAMPPTVHQWGCTVPDGVHMPVGCTVMPPNVRQLGCTVLPPDVCQMGVHSYAANSVPDGVHNYASKCAPDGVHSYASKCVPDGVHSDAGATAARHRTVHRRGGQHGRADGGASLHVTGRIYEEMASQAWWSAWSC